MSTTSEILDGGHAPAVGEHPRPAAVPPAPDGIGVRPGKGVRLVSCPRCSRSLPATGSHGLRLCGVCAAERRTIVRERWTARWRR